MDFIEAEAAEHPDRSRLRLFIREKETDVVIGNVSIWTQGGIWILGYWLAEEFWGQGIMTWACSEVLKQAKIEGVKQVLIDRFKEDNWGSRRVLEKNGFRHLGEEGVLLNGEWHKEWEYEINLDS
jgi:RimJ/RimL family protein N-acetyltransferase